MVRIMLLALLPAAATASKCGPGRKHLSSLTGKFCSTSTTDAASCDASCCVANTDTCGGSGVVCPFGTYAAMDDAWKNKKTTSKTKVADCCVPTATCDNTLYSCPAGLTKTTNAVAKKTKCPNGPKSCAAAAACCVADTKTCGGHQKPANAGNCGTPAATAAKFAKVAFADTDDAWKKKSLSAPAKFTNECCVALPTCASVTCKAGWKAVAAKKTSPIGTDAANGQVKEHDTTAGAGCCELDTAKTTCKTVGGVACPAGEYQPTGYDHILATAANKATKCCAPVATCAAAVCPAGYKMKTNVATLSCTGDHFSCSTKCCEVDKTTCGGLAASTGITCAYGTYDETTAWVLSGDKKTSQATKDAWNKLPATEATKATACCTKQAECKVEPVGSTTPAPVVTTTPLAVI